MSDRLPAGWLPTDWLPTGCAWTGWLPTDWLSDGFHPTAVLPAVIARLHVDARGATPAVSKVMEIAIVVLYLGVITSALYAGMIPDYRDAAGDRIGDRTLVSAAAEIENAVPPATTHVSRQVRVDLPPTIRGEGYWLRVDRDALLLDHPRSRISGRLPLSVPASVVQISGRWASYEPAIISIEGSLDGLTVRLVRG